MLTREQSLAEQRLVAINGTIDLQLLRTFVEVANRGGVTPAAEALHLAKSAVSRHLAALESSFGMRLFERSSRKVALTQEGRRLLPRVETILADMDRLITDVAEEAEQVRGTVRITAPPEFGSFLAERLLPVLLRRYPDIKVLMSLDYQFADLHDPVTDLAFRLGQIGDDRLIARRLGEFARVLVCSPAYALHHPIAKPEDLASVNALLFTDQNNNDLWSLERKDDPAARCEVEVAGNVGIYGFGALSGAAEAGLGVASVPSFFAEPKMKSKALQHVLKGWTSPPVTVYVAYRPNVARIRRVRAVIDLAIETIPSLLA